VQILGRNNIGPGGCQREGEAGTGASRKDRDAILTCSGLVIHNRETHFNVLVRVVGSYQIGNP
jgi:hypothetical protein